MVRKMSKVQMALPSDQEEGYLLWLQDQEIIQLTEMNVGTDLALGNDGLLDLQLAKIQFALEFINRIRRELSIEIKKGFKNMFVSKPMATLDGLEQTVSNMGLSELLTTIRSVHDDLQQINERQRKVSEAIKNIKPWRSLNILGSSISGTKDAHHALISINAKEEVLVKRMLQEISPASVRANPNAIKKNIDKAAVGSNSLYLGLPKIPVTISNGSIKVLLLRATGGISFSVVAIFIKATSG